MNSTPLQVTSVPSGVLVVGTDDQCGKTVLVAGLAVALLEAGFRVQSLKPVQFADRTATSLGLDQAYINKITQQYMSLDTITVPSAWEMSATLWNRWFEPCKSLQYPCLLEAPGQVATPWQITGNTVVDAVDVANRLGLVVLLVSRAETAFLDKTRSALTFLQARQVTPIGFVQVACDETVSNPQEAYWLSREFGVPFLGNMPYSPSISVALLQQGNLIRLIQDNIDLLPLQLGIGLTL